MAKKSSGPNKSQAIRDYYAAHPKAKPLEVSSELAKQGIHVTAGFVSTVKSTTITKKKKGPKKSAKSTAAAAPSKSVARRGRPPGSSNKKAASSNEVSLDSLLQVKKIVEEMGGVQDAKNALMALEKLMG